MRMRWQFARFASMVLAFGVLPACIVGCSDSNPAATAEAPAVTAAAPPPPPPLPVPTAAPPPLPAESALPPATSSAPVASAPVVNDEFAAARSLFDSHGCNRCHGLDANSEGGFAGGPPPEGPPPGPPPGGFGPGGPGRGPGGPPRGPNLAHVGENPEHTQVWIADHIRDPKSHNPRSRMPGFADKMTNEEIDQLAEFLATLK